MIHLDILKSILCFEKDKKFFKEFNLFRLTSGLPKIVWEGGGPRDPPPLFRYKSITFNTPLESPFGLHVKICKKIANLQNVKYLLQYQVREIW